MSTFQQVQAAIQQAQPVAFLGGDNRHAADRDSWAVPVIADFSATGIPATGYTWTPKPFFDKKQFRSLQSVFMDNTGNNGYILVSNPTFNQFFALPPGYQGYFPLLCSELSIQSLSITSTGTGIANIAFISVAMPTSQWAGTVTPASGGGGGGTIAVADAILDATVLGGRVQVSTKTQQVTSVDKSGTIVTANVAQLVMAANAARQKWSLQNWDAVHINSLWYGFSAGITPGAPGAFSLAAATSSQFPGGFGYGNESNALYVVSATAGLQFSAAEVS